MGGYSQVDDWNPFVGSFLLLMLFALTYTFVCKYSAHRSEEVTSKAPNLYLQVCGLIHFLLLYTDTKVSGQRKKTANFKSDPLWRRSWLVWL